ncbi:MAG: beta-lactamase family protein [Oscillospiraceae bacterium]|nr:beta-lactamase family protein [Oscillospiraceae bacterium]
MNTAFIPEGFRGNVMIVRNGAVLCEYSNGYSDLANEISNTTETRFATASAGKAFVAVGILQLIEAGRLRFEDTIGELLDMDLHGIDPDVTVRQLLNHTSGIPDYFDESVMDEYEALWQDYPNYKIRNNRDLLPLFLEKPMMYPKGERFQYNNSGYVMLGLIMEAVTHTAFDEYLKENVFDVCGMDTAGYFALDRLPAKCASSYIYCPDTNSYRTNIYAVDAKGTGAGGAFVTVKDIVHFWQALLSGRLLSAEMTEKMLSKQSGDGSDPEEGWYGYGFWLIEKADGKVIPYFQGCDPGVSFISEYNPDNGMISVAVSNYGDNVWALMRNIRREFY